ncbi:MAG: cupin domain-containing protein [Henriciella sp.]|nr:cupin domain-containing protein [Henriciella sp.]
MLKSIATTVAVLGLTACVSVKAHHHGDSAAVKPPPGSNLMLRGPITISDDLEVIISDVVIPAGASVPRHYHPGEEFVYVIEGSAVHIEAGKPNQILEAGDAYVISPEAEHAPRGGPEGARAIVFRVHKAGLPERINMSDEGPVPDVQAFELGVEAEKITTLMDNIESRGDYHCHAMSRPASVCHLENHRELYVFTEPGDMAHPAALFRGFVLAEDGTPQLQERGWAAGDEDAAKVFFSTIGIWPETGGRPG